MNLLSSPAGRGPPSVPARSLIRLSRPVRRQGHPWAACLVFNVVLGSARDPNVSRSRALCAFLGKKPELHDNQRVAGAGRRAKLTRLLAARAFAGHFRLDTTWRGSRGARVAGSFSSGALARSELAVGIMHPRQPDSLKMPPEVDALGQPTLAVRTFLDGLADLIAEDLLRGAEGSSPGPSELDD